MKKLEDSKDLTEAMITSAIDKTEDEALTSLVHHPCICKTAMHIKHAALRRKRPYHYWIITMGCSKCELQETIIFRLTDSKWRLQNVNSN